MQYILSIRFSSLVLCKTKLFCHFHILFANRYFDLYNELNKCHNQLACRGGGLRQFVSTCLEVLMQPKCFIRCKQSHELHYIHIQIALTVLLIVQSHFVGMYRLFISRFDFVIKFRKCNCTSRMQTLDFQIIQRYNNL